MEQRGAPDCHDLAGMDQLCDAVIAKLAERVDQHLTFNQGVRGSKPRRLTILSPFLLKLIFSQ